MTTHPLTLNGVLLSALHGALVGLLSAVWVDYRIFKRWTKWEDAMTYDWSIASFRWVHGAIVGAVTGAGLGWA